MGGAPITITLYQNGIHVTYGRPELVSAPALEAEMRRSFDAKEEEESLAARLLFDRGLAEIVDVAIDCWYAVDRRDEVFPGTPAPLRAPRRPG